jgi:RNA polymerase sigma-70 factor (ECF subfamily)
MEACLRQERTAQRRLYELMSPPLYQVCKRYLRHAHEVEDVLAEACYLILTRLPQLREWRAFEGWARQITVNQCLAYLRRQTSFAIHLTDDAAAEVPAPATGPPMAAQDLLQLVQQLPDGCRTIFNLYVVEGYSHKEIAAMLGISEGTSKSQLNFSRKKLQELVNAFYYPSAKSHEQQR